MKHFHPSLILAALLLLTGPAAAESDAELLKDLDNLKREIDDAIEGTDELPALERSEALTQTPHTPSQASLAAEEALPPQVSESSAAPEAPKPEASSLETAAVSPKVLEITPATALPIPSYENLASSEPAALIEAIGPDKNAELCRAARRGDAVRAEMLLSHKADPNARLSDGTTALGEAAGAGSLEVVKLLIAAGADVNAKGFLGGTPLISAAAGGHRDVVSLLLSSGADVNAKTSAGVTALNRAEKKGFEEVAALLRRAAHA